MNFSKTTENYYDTLELSSNCSPKEIKESFIQLSKKYHPDRNGDSPEAHKNFIKINEAYEVLSKDRRRYDEFLKLRAFTPKANYQQQRPGFEAESVYEQWLKYGQTAERKYSDFYNYHNAQQNKSNYQFRPGKNIDPSQRWKGVVVCCIIISIGVIGHVFALSRLQTYRENQARKRSEIYSIMYNHGSKNSAKYGQKTYDKTRSGEIKQLTLAEAEAEYEKRHRKD